MAIAIPHNEHERLEALHQYDILDTLEEQAYDDITFLASQICGVPIAMVNFIDKDRQWTKSGHGISVRELPRDVAFCSHAIMDPAHLLLVSDATTDNRFNNNPLVIDEPQIRFYAGAPLVTPGGTALGALCVIDRTPKELTENQQACLQALSRQVVAHLELRRTLQELGKHVQERAQYEAQLEAYQIKLEAANASLFQESLTDKLTGLSNRRHFDETLAEEFDRSFRRDRPLSAIMVDIDHFKKLNDTFGHSVGDETLRTVSNLLVEGKRPSDFAARYGGEEFVVLLPNTSEEGAMILAERMRKGVQNHHWPHRPITISLGVCTYHGTDHGVGKFLAATDAALYISKQTGRNRVTLGSLPPEDPVDMTV